MKAKMADYIRPTLTASGPAKLVKPAVEGLPVGADAGMADKAFFRLSFGHILCKP